MAKTSSIISALRQQIAAIERAGGPTSGRLSDRAGLIAAADGRAAALRFGLAAVDGELPWGGLPGACLHEVMDGAAASRQQRSAKTVIDAAVTGFAAALLGPLARRRGKPVIWIAGQETLYGPGLAAFGLSDMQLIAVTAENPIDALWAMEESLRAGCAAAVVAEVAGLDLTASRRLQLAAETGGSLGLLLLPPPAIGEAGEVRLAPSASVTRWRISTMASAPARPAKLVGAPRWQVELLRCRGGAPRSWLLEWSHATRGFTVAAPLPDRPVVPAAGQGGYEGWRALAS